MSIAAPDSRAPDAERLLLRRGYARAVAAAGGTPLLVPPEADPAEVARLCQGIVVSGGANLPTSFTDASAPVKDAENAERVAWDRRLLDAVHALGRPLLGVCYGMQLLNLHHGGTLHDDLYAKIPAALDHGGGGRASEHEVVVARESALSAAIGPVASVCSRHQQAVHRVAHGFRTVASAPDGVIEAIEAESLAALGVEWHPEADATGAAIYGWLVRRAQDLA